MLSFFFYIQKKEEKKENNQILFIYAKIYKQYKIDSTDKKKTGYKGYQFCNLAIKKKKKKGVRVISYATQFNPTYF